MQASTLIDKSREQVREAYGHAIGREASEVVTPALLLDLPAALRNIAHMAERISSLPSDLRPHIKVHKSPDLARLQVEHGAIGLSVATVWEAVAMVAAGFDDIFIVNTLTGRSQIRTITELARDHRVLVAVDDASNARALASAAQEAGSTLGVLLEIDTGMDRAGVDTEEDALAVARELVSLRGLHFEGVTGYEGHCSLTPDREERAAKQRDAMEFFTGVAQRLSEDGIPVGIRSAGGTATWEWTAAYPGITEIQAGSYVVMDNFHGRMVPEFETALSVAATVISCPPGRIIVDAGSKSVAAPDLATIKGSSLPNFRFDEEHGVFAIGPQAPALGNLVELIPGYAPSTVNMFDAYHVIEDGIVVDIWPIVPRGPGHHGLAALPQPGRTEKSP